MNADWLRGIYRLALRLLPRAFREEFGEEMEAVFAQALQDAAAQGWRALVRTLASEAAGLAGEIARQAAASRKGRETSPPACRAASEREVLLGLGAFLLPFAALALNRETAAARLADVGVGAMLAGLLVMGLARGLPRWSLPYLGLAAAAAAFTCLFQWGADLLSLPALARWGLVPGSASGRLLLQAVWAGLAWLMLFVTAGAVLGLLALVGRLQSLLDHLRQDWTLASYTLYSGVLAGLVLSPLLPRAAYSPGQKPYLLLAVACLAMGAWLYLAESRTLMKWLALLAGVSLALPACALGGLPLLPALEGLDLPERRPLLEWALLAAALLTPMVLRKSDRHAVGGKI